MLRAKRIISFDDQTSRLSRSKLVVVFLGLSFTIFLSLADQVTVATAAPVIGKALEAGESIAWVGTSYLIANTSSQLIYGRFSDIFGRKLCLLVAITLLVIGNLICGFSNTPAMLYVFRSIAGIGGGGMTNLSMVIVSDVVSLEERGKWQGILSAGAAAGSAAGPFIGAALSEQVSWRWTFWIMCPCGVVCAAVIFFCLPLTPVTGSARQKLKKLDYYGAILSLAANVFILIPISSGGTTFAWSSPTVIVLLIIGVFTAAAFIIVEWKVAPLPVMPLRLWTYRTTAITLGTTFFIGMIYFSNLFFLPIYFQVLLGMSPIKSASFLLSLLVVQVCSSLLAGIITPYTKKVLPQVRVGFFIWTIGAGLQTTFNRQTKHANLVGLLILQGFGVGCTLQTTLVAAQAGAPNKDRACVTGTRNCLRFMGGAFGLAICNAILNNVIKARLPSSIPDDVKRVITRQISPELPSSLGPEVVEAIYSAYEDALHYIFIFFVPVVGVAFVSSCYLSLR
ncbi:MFS general substrate transporter [Cystobasidium minutum MCA 4210]|uniref:MFS general substrate transporter n=1 Tax=Cystobasidium minutum MCA 4210 TaxID=1397322 RepID=UPI0034CEF63C|eukprot:jgi/Rhomi1/140220/e_gw1.1.433.1